MEITKRLIGCSAIDAAKGQVADVDMEGLVRRLLLFDQYVMVSVRLQEFPHLVRYLGYEGLRDLLFSRALEIRCEWFQLAQVAQSGLCLLYTSLPSSARAQRVASLDTKRCSPNRLPIFAVCPLSPRFVMSGLHVCSTSALISTHSSSFWIDARSWESTVPKA